MILDSMFEGGLLINLEDLTAAVIAALLVAALALFFQFTSTGRALRGGRRPPGRAVHRHPAEPHLGHRVERGRPGGAGGRHHLGLEVRRAVHAVHGRAALPVVILGGLTSVPGAILGGLIIGVGEKLSEVYLGSLVGGGIEIWFAYVLALVFLLFRPQGLFGEKIIDRV